MRIELLGVALVLLPASSAASEQDANRFLVAGEGNQYVCSANSTRTKLFKMKKKSHVPSERHPYYNPPGHGASPTYRPHAAPTARPSKSPVANPTTTPFASPTRSPHARPTIQPSDKPVPSPVSSPTSAPTRSPVTSPTGGPYDSPTADPTGRRYAPPTPVDRSPTFAPSEGGRIDIITMSPTTGVPTAAPTVEVIAPPVQLKCPTLSPIFRNESNYCHGGVELDCNQNLNGASCQPLSSYSNFLSNAASQMAVIPCGVCVTVDVTDGSMLEFPKGIRVEGKLWFPSTASLTVKTKFIIVQGLLKIDPPDDQLTIRLYDDTQMSFELEDGSLTPTIEADDGEESFCNIGSKAIAVMGGRLDIRGNDANCPGWEKMEALGQGVKKPFDIPCEGNECLDLTIGGYCAISSWHKTNHNTDVVYCPLVQTLEVSTGEPAALSFTSLAPLNPPPALEMPKNPDTGAALKLIMAEKPKNSTWHSEEYKRCVLRMPVEQEPWNAHDSNYLPTTFSSKPGTGTYSPPAGLSLVVKNTPSKSNWWYNTYGIDMYFINVQDTVTVGSEYRMVNLVNRATQEKIACPDGLYRVANNGNRMFISTDRADLSKLQEVFPVGSVIDIELAHDLMPAGETFDVESIMHFAWDGKNMYFTPAGYGVHECDQAADDFYDKFRPGMEITVEHRYALPVAPGQSVEAAGGIMHWSWSGKNLIFAADDSPESAQARVDDMNAKFPPGYRIQVSYTHLQDMYEVKVSPEAARCWGKAGTQLLITSHTHDFQDEQVVEVASVNTATNIITLTDKIEIPITMEDSTDYAVEIASLTRPVVFETQDGNGDKVGGHIIIKHTNLPQTIEGVRIENFGQLGRIARYPINFHTCGNLTSTSVKRNVIFNSYQRGISLLETNGIEIKDNVVYNVTGHGYALDSGYERGHVFRHNLGTAIWKMPGSENTKLNLRSCRGHSDNLAAVFFIKNPDNEYYHNIAAGSEKYGIWISTDEPYQHLDTLGFDYNEAHSTHSEGFTTWYPGWKPRVTNVIRHLKVYRCNWNAVLLANARNLEFYKCLFADQRYRSVYVLRSDEITFRESHFEAVTGYAPEVGWCHSGGYRGLTIHAELEQEFEWRPIKGVSVVNTVFKGYSPSASGCEGTTPMNVPDNQLLTRAFYSPTYFRNVNFVNSEKFDVCEIHNGGLKEAIMNVVQDNHNMFSSNGAVGMLASPEVKLMLPANSCTPYNSCLDFCPGTCLRSIRFITNSAYWEWGPVDMHVKDVNSGRTITILNQLRLNSTDNVGHHGTYTVALPKSQYDIKFIRRSDGELVWPSYVIPVIEHGPISCNNYVDYDDLNIIRPSSDRGVCDDLILNSEFETGVQGWQSWSSSIYPKPGYGVGGSMALTTLRREWYTWQGPRAWLDSSCVKPGNIYDIRIRLRNIENITGTTIHACANGEMEKDCPKAYIVPQTHNRTTGELVTIGWYQLAFMEMTSYTEHGFNLNSIYGQWFVDQAQIADRYGLLITHGTAQLLIDNVHVEKATYRDVCVRNQVYNSGMYTKKYWYGWGNGVRNEAPGVAGSGNTSLIAYGRDGCYRGVHNNRMRDQGCFHAGDKWLAKFKAQLYWQSDGTPVTTCDPHDPEGLDCPMLRLHTMHIIDGKTVHRFHEIRDTSMTWYAMSAGSPVWNTFDVTFEIPEDMVEEELTLVRFMIVGGPRRSILNIDDVVFRMLGDDEGEGRGTADIGQQEIST